MNGPLHFFGGGRARIARPRSLAWAEKNKNGTACEQKEARPGPPALNSSILRPAALRLPPSLQPEKAVYYVTSGVASSDANALFAVQQVLLGGNDSIP